MILAVFGELDGQDLVWAALSTVSMILPVSALDGQAYDKYACVRSVSLAPFSPKCDHDCQRYAGEVYAGEVEGGANTETKRRIGPIGHILLGRPMGFTEVD